VKVCIIEHDAPGFGLVPVGSLWADDSPYIGTPGCFADVADERAQPKPARKRAAKTTDFDVVTED